MLYAAAFYAHSKTVALLLSRGADPNLYDESGRTPLMVADYIHDVELESDCAQQLIAHGDAVNTRDHSGRTPIFYAETSTRIRLLVRHNADVNSPDGKGRTALMQAIAGADTGEHANQLLDCGADVRVMDRAGRSTLEYARRIGDRFLVERIKRALAGYSNRHRVR